MQYKVCPKGAVKGSRFEKGAAPKGGGSGYAVMNYSTVKTTLEASGDTVPSSATARTSSL